MNNEAATLMNNENNKDENGDIDDEGKFID